jgi:hypothetical protein
MWSLEMIKYLNQEQQESLPLNLIKEQMLELNFKVSSFKVLPDPIVYKNSSYNYIVPATKRGLDFIDLVKTLSPKTGNDKWSSKSTLFVSELNVYLLQ